MSAINYDLVRWPLRKWLATSLLLLGLHLWLIWKFSAPDPKAGALPVPISTVSVAPPGPPPAASLAAIEDPLIFAAAHPNGFSGAAWVKKPQRNYALRSRLPNPAFLDPALAKSLFPEQLADPVLVAPNVRRARPEVELVANDPLPAKSTLRMEEGLAARGLVRKAAVPVQHHSDALGNTVVQVGVSGHGQVLSARVITPSGSKKADQDALGISRSLRFKPVVSPLQERPSENLQWGKLIFEWFTLDLAGTNAPPK